MSVRDDSSNLVAHPMRKAMADTCRFVSIKTPAPRDVWRKVMLQDADALPYQSPEWIESACATGRYADASRLYKTEDGEHFVLPMLKRSGLPDWLNIATSMPESWGIGGPLGSVPITRTVLAAIIEDLRDAGFLAAYIRPNPLHASLWQSLPIGLVIPRRAHVIDLEGGFDRVWGNFSSQVRRIIRKAERTVEVEFDSSGRLLPHFYELLEKSWLRWAKAQHEPKALALWRARHRDPYTRFEQTLAAMGKGCEIGVAYLHGRPVAANMVLRNGNSNYTRGAIDADLIGNSGANDLLQKLAIEQSANAGHRFYHMGETGRSASLSRFKQKFGAIAYDYAEYRLERLPLTHCNTLARGAVKRLIGFKDAG